MSRTPSAGIARQATAGVLLRTLLM
ncbi:hypothetical protein Q604_UNBC05052G0001, partial [human gut metagenome]